MLNGVFEEKALECPRFISFPFGLLTLHNVRLLNLYMYLFSVRRYM